MSEQFGFDQFSRHRCAIKSHKRTSAARAFLVNGARDEFLARARLSLNGDAGFTRGDAFHLRQQTLHQRPGPDDFMLSEAAAQIPIFVFQMPQPQNVFDGDKKLFRGERFLQKIDCAEPRGSHGHLHAGLARNHHDGCRHSVAFKSSSSEIPSLPGMTTSEKITSNRSARISSRARTALSHTVAS